MTKPHVFVNMLGALVVTFVGGERVALKPAEAHALATEMQRLAELADPTLAERSER